MTPEQQAADDIAYLERGLTTNFTGGAFGIECTRAKRILAYIAALRERADQAQRVAAEGRAAGRMEAAAILLRQSAEEFPPDKMVRSYEIGCSGDYGVEWVESEVLALFDAGNAPATKSLIEGLDHAFWSVVSDLESAKERAEQVERERDEARADRKVLARMLNGPALAVAKLLVFEGDAVLRGNACFEGAQTAAKHLLADMATDAAGALQRASVEALVVERCEACGGVNDADKEHDCGQASPDDSRAGGAK